MYILYCSPSSLWSSILSLGIINVERIWLIAPAYFYVDNPPSLRSIHDVLSLNIMSTTRPIVNVFRNRARLQLQQHYLQCRPRTSILFASISFHRSRFHLSTSTTIRASLASTLPSQPTVLLHKPSQEDIAEKELDLDLLPPELVKLDITDRAAEACITFSALDF